MDKEPPTVADIEAAIIRYLHEHPHVVDTERGIREWWLPGSGPCRPSDVHAAIELLVACGTMAERSLPDGQRAYSWRGVRLTRPQGPS